MRRPSIEERNVDEETLLERFEAWHIEEHGWFDMKARVCAERWAGFKAHAECCPVVVELPDTEWLGAVDPEPGLSESAVRAAIEAAGGKVAR